MTYNASRGILFVNSPYSNLTLTDFQNTQQEPSHYYIQHPLTVWAWLRLSWDCNAIPRVRCSAGQYAAGIGVEEISEEISGNFRKFARHRFRKFPETLFLANFRKFPEILGKVPEISSKFFENFRTFCKNFGQFFETPKNGVFMLKTTFYLQNRHALSSFSQFWPLNVVSNA